jgi:uncharacterized membrane protein
VGLPPDYWFLVLAATIDTHGCFVIGFNSGRSIGYRQFRHRLFLGFAVFLVVVTFDCSEAPATC